MVRVSDTEEEDTVPEYPLGVRVEMEEGGVGEHDFSQAGSCSVRGRVMLEARDKGVMVQYGLREQVKGTRITGNIGEMRCDEWQILIPLLRRWFCLARQEECI